MAPPPPPYGSLPPNQYQAMQDEEHLRLLSIFYYVMGGFAVLASFFAVFYIIMGVVMANTPMPMPATTVTMKPPTGFPAGFPTPMPFTPPTTVGVPQPSFVGWIFAGFGIVGMLVMWIIAALDIYAGRCLAQHRNKTFIQVIAALNCLHMPFGTALGVFTFIVLSRPSASALFETRPVTMVP